MISNTRILDFGKKIMAQIPADWQRLTTHRLDIYNESLAKTEFLEQLESLMNNNKITTTALANLPTAYDYIRLGHPLSCLLEWVVAQEISVNAEQVISFDSLTMPIMAVLRSQLLAGKKTQIVYKNRLPEQLDIDRLKKVYKYDFECIAYDSLHTNNDTATTRIFIEPYVVGMSLSPKRDYDFHIYTYEHLGSIIILQDSIYTGDIQHVRRRETIAMTPENTEQVLKLMLGSSDISKIPNGIHDKKRVQNLLKEITNTSVTPVVASSGLSMQYAIMMGLIEYAQEQYTDQLIQFIVPTNCYGGTNDQARRVAACYQNVDIVDLQVDGDTDMVSSLKKVLDEIAHKNAIPFIIAEIPTNPRVEVPELHALHQCLTQQRITANGDNAVLPTFILDQTFCPNVDFLSTGKVLHDIAAIAYASGSKFPSGGKCTAGYAVANDNARAMMKCIENHLALCDNKATLFQNEILSQQLPSMIKRIQMAYKNTYELVQFIKEVLPQAKINFVNKDLAAQGFQPSVFSLDLPTKGNTEAEKEGYKREQNLRLINLMITHIPNESKYCVSYGQLKGCYWTIPATSTQGTTKESDKDYIARVALAPEIDLEKHKQVFKLFVDGM